MHLNVVHVWNCSSGFRFHKRLTDNPRASALSSEVYCQLQKKEFVEGQVDLLSGWYLLYNNIYIDTSQMW